VIRINPSQPEQSKSGYLVDKKKAKDVPEKTEQLAVRPERFNWNNIELWSQEWKNKIDQMKKLLDEILKLQTAIQTSKNLPQNQKNQQENSNNIYPPKKELINPEKDSPEPPISPISSSKKKKNTHNQYSTVTDDEEDIEVPTPKPEPKTPKPEKKENSSTDKNTPVVIITPKVPKSIPYTWFNYLTPSQRESVMNSLTCDHFYLIHGPPGTGKSSTLLAIIDAIWKAEMTVMIVTKSDAGLDHLVRTYAKIGKNKKISSFTETEKNEFRERVHKRQSTMCRFGYTWTTAEDCKKYLFEDIFVKRYAQSFKIYQPNEANKSKIVKELLSNIRVIFTPLDVFYNNTQSNYLKDMKFDYCIIDEACQCRITESMMPLESVDRVIYAGDQKQLGVMTNHPNASADAKLSLFEKMISKIDKLPPNSKQVFSMLNIQFRMNSELMDISRSLFYDDLLQDDEKVKSICLRDFSKVVPGSGLIPLDRPLIWIDNPRFESQPRKGQFVNVYEQIIIAYLLIELVCNMGVLPDQIGVICGYNNQRNFIKTLLNHIAKHEKDKEPLRDIKVSTVDAFQGQEREVIIFATTRSNEGLSIGFLDKAKRFNVSVTRARRLLIVVGNIETLKKDNHYCKLYNLAAEKGGLLEAVVNVEDTKQKMISLDGNQARNQKSSVVIDEGSKLHNPIQFDLALNGRLYNFGKQVFLSSKDFNVKFAKQHPKLLNQKGPSPPSNNQAALIQQPLPQNQNSLDQNDKRDNTEKRNRRRGRS